MRLPRLDPPRLRRVAITAFSGLDRSPRAPAGALREMRNLSSDLTPVLAPRPCRGVVPDVRLDPARIRGGLADLGGLCYIADGLLYWQFEGQRRSIDLGLSEEGPKRLVRFGAYLIVLPDKAYVNTTDPDDHGRIDASVTVHGGAAPFYDPDAGASFESLPFGPTEPSSPQDGDHWADTSVTPAQQRRYSALSGTWRAVPTYYRLSGGQDDFRPGDCVQVVSITGEVFFDCAEVVERVEDGLIVAAPPRRLSHPSYVIRRQMPRLDFCFEHENRLWGCRYGRAADGSFVNELYASKLGDFRNWNSFLGLSTDSYIASCGAGGAWTGAISALGYPLFFKEGCLYRVSGDTPASFRVQATPCRGVQSGSAGSLAVVGDALYYLAQGGVMRYDGSPPVEVSQPLGGERFTGGVACGFREKYYISMHGADGWALYVLDTRRGLWHREDELHAEALAASGDGLYCIPADGEELLDLMGGGIREEAVRWMAETGELGLDEPEHLSRVELRLTAPPGARLTVLARYDGSWEPVGELRGRSLRSVTLPLRLRRCDHVRLRLEGEGPVRVYSLGIYAS